MSEGVRAGQVFHCPFCAEEDLRPAEEAGAWLCRSCARVFSVRLLSVAEQAIPGRLAQQDEIDARRSP